MTAPRLDLGALGWDDSWQALASATMPTGEPGRVARVDRGVCTVVTASGPVRASHGPRVLEAMAADARATPCTGDWCLVRHWPDGPVTVESVLDRRTAVVRATASGTSKGQVLVANIDVLAAVVGLHPEPVMTRVERLVTLGWDSGAQPVVLLTKADLVRDGDLVADDVRAAVPGVEVLVCSTVDGRGVPEVLALVEGHRTLGLLGASGHGKSSLINALVGTDVLRTEQIRADGKGRHTSVRRELVTLPGGGAVIDTPGLRGIGLQESEDGLASTFPDIEALAGQCRFQDCGHVHEPGCAVQAAVADGVLPARRLDSWLRLRREIAWMAARTDARLRAEQRKKWKAQTKLQRGYHR